MNSLKLHPGQPCPTLLCPADGRPAAVFYPFGHPTPYAYVIYRSYFLGKSADSYPILPPASHATKHAPYVTMLKTGFILRRNLFGYTKPQLCANSRSQVHCQLIAREKSFYESKAKRLKLSASHGNILFGRVMSEAGEFLDQGTMFKTNITN
jgi:hypothetical protein